MLANAAFAAASEAPVKSARDVQNNALNRRSMISLQDGMRAVFITPDVDFELQNADFSELYGEIRGFGMNAVIINSVNGDSAYYDFDLSSKSENILSAAIDAAHSANLSAYLTMSAKSLVQRVVSGGGGLKEGFSAAAHKFAMKYGCEGIILTDYYTKDSPELYEEYLRSGSGIGYEHWIYETNQYIIRTLSEVVQKTTNTTAVGILIEDMWANASSNEEGSDTEDIIQALYDGHCDTKKYVESNYFDFVMVKAYGSTEDYSLNFEKAVSWWYDLALDHGVKTYVCHLNERVGAYTGWHEDQLLRQLAVMEKMEKIGGSAFNSLSALEENVLASTDTLKDYFNKQINPEALFKDLTMVSPSQLSFVTYDNTVKFMGSFDENFDVKFDGEKIKLNEVGNFFFEKELEVGWNYFTIEHKGTKYSYSIDRHVDVLKSIESTSDVVVEGGTTLALVAVAYSGSDVYAEINGQTVVLKEKTASEELDANGSYSKFVGYYQVGDGVVGRDQYLGTVEYYASYKGSYDTMEGGSVTIEAKPEPPRADIKWDIIDQSTAGTGEVVGTMDPILTEEDYVTYVMVLDNYTDVLDAKTTGAIPSPEFSQMPAGTLDYYKSSSDGYITTTSGKRYRSYYVTTFDDTGLGYNALVVKSIGNTGGNSFLKLSLDYKSSFNVTTSINYVQGYEGPYGVNYFDAEYVYITFDNVTSVTKLPDFDSCTLFSAGEWQTVEENGVPKFRLALTLRQAGIYSGVGAYYDENSDLMLTFNVPTATLSGKVIVIDPGHGMTDSGFDPGAIGEVTEQSINLAVAKKLEEQLTAMGASVIRLQTESENIIDRDRPRAAVSYNADMFLSLHCNSAVNKDAHGCEVYYFTPWSKTLAKAINDNLAYFYDESYADGTDSSRGDKYSYYHYTLEQSLPSVLVEMGFVSNERECLFMASPDNQDGMAQAIANGIYAYFERSSLSY